MKNPRPTCPNADCVNHTKPPRGFYRKKGYRKPQHDHQPVPVYQCKACGRKFSATTYKPIWHQRRPDINRRIFEMAVSGTSMRRMQKLLGCAKGTITRKVGHLAKEAERRHREHMAPLRTAYVMFDELETFVHARYKQVSVPVAIRVKTGEILAFDICRTPSKLPLGGAGAAGVAPGGSRWQTDERPAKIPVLFASLRPVFKLNGTLATDGDMSYPKWIQRTLNGIGLTHDVRHSPKENAVGRARRKASGELRENDPLFAINVLFAKMRNDLARLGRKTWTTTKTIEGLRNHLWLYVAWNNGYRLR